MVLVSRPNIDKQNLIRSFILSIVMCGFRIFECRRKTPFFTYFTNVVLILMPKAGYKDLRVSRLFYKKLHIFSNFIWILFRPQFFIFLWRASPFLLSPNSINKIYRDYDATLLISMLLSVPWLLDFNIKFEINYRWVLSKKMRLFSWLCLITNIYLCMIW